MTKESIIMSFILLIMFLSACMYAVYLTVLLQQARIIVNCATLKDNYPDYQSLLTYLSTHSRYARSLNHNNKNGYCERQYGEH